MCTRDARGARDGRDVAITGSILIPSPPRYHSAHPNQTMADQTKTAFSPSLSLLFRPPPIHPLLHGITTLIPTQHPHTPPARTPRVEAR